MVSGPCVSTGLQEICHRIADVRLPSTASSNSEHSPPISCQRNLSVADCLFYTSPSIHRFNRSIYVPRNYLAAVFCLLIASAPRPTANSTASKLPSAPTPPHAQYRLPAFLSYVYQGLSHRLALRRGCDRTSPRPTSTERRSHHSVRSPVTRPYDSRLDESPDIITHGTDGYHIRRARRSSDLGHHFRCSKIDLSAVPLDLASISILRNLAILHRPRSRGFYIVSLWLIIPCSQPNSCRHQ